jgi:hypothetical protein
MHVGANLRYVVWAWFGAACSVQVGTSPDPADADVRAAQKAPSVEILQPMTVASAATVMVNGVRDSRKTACAQLLGFRSTQLCVFVDAVVMGYAFKRAAFYIEQRPGYFLSDQAIAGESAIAGVDLESSALAVFYGNWQARLPKLADATTPEQRTALEVESAFWRDYVTTKVLPDPRMVLLAIPSDGYQASVFDHELVHATFFETPAMDAAVQDFLANVVEPQDFSAIQATLKPYYALSDARLIRNEFAAYMLMSDAKNSNLGEFVEKYAGRLRTHLSANGITVNGHAGSLL